jgi:hypothetical protein
MPMLFSPTIGAAITARSQFGARRVIPLIHRRFRVSNSIQIQNSRRPKVTVWCRFPPQSTGKRSDFISGEFMHPGQRVPCSRMVLRCRQPLGRRATTMNGCGGSWSPPTISAAAWSPRHHHERVRGIVVAPHNPLGAHRWETLACFLAEISIGVRGTPSLYECVCHRRSPRRPAGAGATHIAVQ